MSAPRNRSAAAPSTDPAYEATLTAGDQGETSDGTVRVAPVDGCAERQSPALPSPAASVVREQYHVPRSQVWAGSRGRQSGRVHLHVDGRVLCGARNPWYGRDPMEGEARCARCVARAEKRGFEWPARGGAR